MNHSRTRIRSIYSDVGVALHSKLGIRYTVTLWTTIQIELTVSFLRAKGEVKFKANIRFFLVFLFCFVEEYNDVFLNFYNIAMFDAVSLTFKNHLFYSDKFKTDVFFSFNISGPI